MRAVNIQWDTDGDQDVLESLPKEADIPEDVGLDDIGDWLSDQYGWCHFGYGLEPDSRIPRIPVAPLTETPMPFLPDDVTWELCFLRDESDFRDVCLAKYGEDGESRRPVNAGMPAYPCWAVFSQDEDRWGRCEGAWLAVCAKWQEFAGRMVLEMDKMDQRFSLPKPHVRKGPYVFDRTLTCDGCKALKFGVWERCAKCVRSRRTKHVEGLEDLYEPFPARPE